MERHTLCLIMLSSLPALEHYLVHNSLEKLGSSCKLTCIPKWAVPKLQFSQLDTTHGNEGKAGVTAAAVGERDDVQIASVLSDVTHSLVSNHHIRQTKSAEAKRQPPRLRALHQKRLHSQVQCRVPFQLYDLQNSTQKKPRLVHETTYQCSEKIRLLLGNSRKGISEISSWMKCSNYRFKLDTSEKK